MMNEMAQAMTGNKPFPWGDYQRRIMKISGPLIKAGLSSPKDINSMLADIDARKNTSSGGAVSSSGGDLLAEWLSDNNEAVN